MAPWPYSKPEYWNARAEVLRGGPPCAVTPGCARRADTVDHWPVTVLMVREGRAPAELLWDPTNLRPACRSCNSRLGARAGNRRRGKLRSGLRERRSGDLRSRRW